MASRKKKQTKDEKINSIYNDMAENINDLASNIISIVVEVNKERRKQKNKKKQEKLELEVYIQIMVNFVLNQQSRLALMTNYILNIYRNKDAIDKRNANFFFGNTTMFDNCEVPSEVIEFVKDCFIYLWENHMNDEEKERVFTFFDAFNAMAEDWMKLGGHHVYNEDEIWKGTYDVIEKIEQTLSIEVPA